MKRTLRTLFELIVYLIAVILLAAVGGRLVRLFLGPSEGHPEWLRFLVSGSMLLLGVALVHAYLRRRGKTEYSEDGWQRGLANLSALGVGALIGLVMIVITEGLLLATGCGYFAHNTGTAGEYLRMFLPVFTAIGLLAFAEEVLFRGYPFAKLASLTGPAWANVIISLLFASAHLGNEGTGWMVILNITLGSLVIGLVRVSKWGVPAAGGFHAAWNVTQTMIGGTVSGVASPMPAVQLLTRGPDLLTGGAFGPEGSLWATLATLFVLFLLFHNAKRLRIEHALPARKALFSRRQSME